MSTSLPPENRFTECIRKAREARARLVQATREREETARRVPRDRDYVTAEPHGSEPASAGTSATSAIERALAALVGKDGKNQA